MSTELRSERSMPWLQPVWKRKREQTAARVSAAVDHLRKAKQPVTLSTIRDAVRLLFQVSMSTNTIQRNAEAYAMYLDNRTHVSRLQARSAALRTVLSSVVEENEASVRTRVNRLRREPKDTLIARIIELESNIKQGAGVQDRLRDEILRLTLGSTQKGTP